MLIEIDTTLRKHVKMHTRDVQVEVDDVEAL